MKHKVNLCNGIYKDIFTDIMSILLKSHTRQKTLSAIEAAVWF